MVVLFYCLILPFCTIMKKLEQSIFLALGIKLTSLWASLYEARSSRRQWHPTLGLLPGESHGWRSLVGCSPWGPWGSDTTEWLHFHFSLSCIGEGNGNPLQCSCLDNPRDSGAWWAAVYGVTQSRTRLKWLSSSSSRSSRWDLHPIYVWSPVTGLSW